ncbi:hypothetical protein HN587_04475 [Candidatus Woesearchaeota archaeon]|jgi:uncharacterized protein with PQ loop repeat|nr:hypothetical protein [Candidatus Woesearchaeota archaeon]
MQHTQHHIHKRKAVHKNNQKHFISDKKIKLLDGICTWVAVIMPLSALPQIHKIYFLKQTEGVSLLMWLLLFFLSIPLFIYGVVHKEKPILILNLLWLIMQSIVVIGLLIF